MAARTAADSARDRIVVAATAEFARHGIAGARIERIAKAARTSKERLYAYFRSKEDLYATVVARELTAVTQATQLDPADLPGYAGRLHDYFTAHPDRLRLMDWGRLELATTPETGTDDPMRAAMLHKTDQLREAQQAGQLPEHWDPADILMFVSQLAMSWVSHPELTPPHMPDRDAFLGARREAIVTAVQCLFPAASPVVAPTAKRPQSAGKASAATDGSMAS
ncbi:TetR family transcriptional regulator [Streptomyces sp. NPDC005070]